MTVHYIDIIEGCLEVKLPTIWTDEKQRWEESEKRRRKKIKKRKPQKKEDPGAQKGRKVAKHLVFSNDLWLQRVKDSKNRLAKAAGAEPCGHIRDEKLHAVVARSTYGSQNAQNTQCSDRFWKLRFRKSARHCGVKHISKSKCIKHLSVGPLLEVDMSKKCTRLWREAHMEVKMHKTHNARTTFGSGDVEKVQAIVAHSTYGKSQCTNRFWKLRCRKSARHCGAKHISSQNAQKTSVSDHFWKLTCRKSARHCGAKHISKSKVFKKR